MKLHIPYVVEREFQTQQREIYSKDIDKAISGLTGLARRQLSPELAKRISEIKTQVDGAREEVLSDAEMQIVQWEEGLSGFRIARQMHRHRQSKNRQHHGCRVVHRGLS